MCCYLCHQTPLCHHILLCHHLSTSQYTLESPDPDILVIMHSCITTCVNIHHCVIKVSRHVSCHHIHVSLFQSLSIYMPASPFTSPDILMSLTYHQTLCVTDVSPNTLCHQTLCVTDVSPDTLCHRRVTRHCVTDVSPDTVSPTCHQTLTCSGWRRTHYCSTRGPSRGSQSPSCDSRCVHTCRGSRHRTWATCLLRASPVRHQTWYLLTPLVAASSADS